jgi:hypothetical protein
LKRASGDDGTFVLRSICAIHTEDPIMTDPGTFTAEHRSWQWELVLQYEDGSLPPTAWSASTLATIATWYAKNLSSEQAKARYEQYFHRTRRRLMNRLDSASVATSAIEAVDAVWESLLTRALEAGK